MKPGDDLLDLPAERGAARVALLLCREADEAAWRLRLGEDDEALHDFRVALRRLRSALRAWRAALPGKAGGPLARAVKEVAAWTGPARDAEVQRAWLASAREGLSPAGQAAADRLAARYEARRGAEAARLRDRAVPRWDRLSARLSRRLARRLEAGGAGRAPFGRALAERLREAQREVERRLWRVAGASDEARAHRARIAAKRLRYLLEPLRKSARASSKEAVAALKELQDLLGELHDRHVLAGELGALAEDGAGPGALADGLGELGRRARDDAEALFGRARAWREEGLLRLATEVERVARAAEGEPARDRAPATPA
ncbi:CHAD domain-containing protein [Anaeromyxobacter paludicola]|uniref:CHAD domain-containing protein n=1 Tax=Anaeromyxobacter paludicola TaxID=2918171 RepID=A0ABN6NCQ0_9BACT|nr:CHAD domain-containing protein [Anaeromyxobacter paludicola]BDG10866.1 hypothetical protein AMPC_39790 [Anaeromyxobacter paludicola]